MHLSQNHNLIHNSNLKFYIRDGRSPIPKCESISRVMSANKSKDTTPEIALRKTLWVNGFRGYRVHYNKIPGRPDICFVSRKIAIFVNGCFWHRCPSCVLPLPKSNSSFWAEKFNKNIQRDKIKIEKLNSLGWKSYVFWECEIKRDIISILTKIQKAIL